MITRELYIVPIRIESEANKAEHWSRKSSRHKRHKRVIQLIMAQSTLKPPCEVILTRIAPRLLDAEDNLPAALKFYKDVVADKLIPNLAAGRADGSHFITWQLKQEKGKPKDYALKIEIIKTYGTDNIDSRSDCGSNF